MLEVSSKKDGKVVYSLEFDEAVDTQILLEQIKNAVEGAKKASNPVITPASRKATVEAKPPSTPDEILISSDTQPQPKAASGRHNKPRQQQVEDWAGKIWELQELSVNMRAVLYALLEHGSPVKKIPKILELANKFPEFEPSKKNPRQTAYFLVRTLTDRGLLEERPSGGRYLTEAGLAIAKQIKEDIDKNPPILSSK